MNASGTVGIVTSQGNIGSINVNQYNGALCPSVAALCGVTSISFTASNNFRGYLESIKVAAVPIPASFDLLALGLAGLGAASRARRKS